ncbi:MAG TPA: NADPH-dependent F420 reductase [Blastocatellia bacterium]|jgi:NADPH-dependent F420 reductase|nr:NADPH-dependent F420 reductase [Blastocatellia bacterium]
MDIKATKIGIIGGTGEEGRGLALRWAMAGARVTIGSRSAERAKEAADELNAIAGSDLILYADNRAAVAGADFVLLTVPFEHAAATVESLADGFKPGSILIDITVPVSFDKGRVRYVELPEGSASEHLQARLPESVPLVAAFKTEPAHLLLDPGAALDCDVFVASDSKEARARVMEAIPSIEGFRPVDAGTLYSARTLERMTVLLIGINRRYKVKTGRFRVVGLE